MGYDFTTRRREFAERISEASGRALLIDLTQKPTSYEILDLTSSEIEKVKRLLYSLQRDFILNSTSP